MQSKPVKADRETKALQSHRPDVITVMPTLNAYEPEPELDMSTIIPNQAAASPEPLHTSQVLENDYTTTPDPLYSTVEEVDTSVPSEIAAYNPALLKQLKKHDDRGTVQLVSIKGVDRVSTSKAMSFPKGSSANMHPLHYAAASGDRKALSEIISALPISQDTVEMLLGTENLVKREGVDVTDSEGRTPLMHAVHNNQLHAVKMLAENGANVNIASTGKNHLLAVALLLLMLLLLFIVWFIVAVWFIVVVIVLFVVVLIVVVILHANI